MGARGGAAYRLPAADATGRANRLAGERLQVEVVPPGRDLAVLELEHAEHGQVERALAVALAEVLEALDGDPPLVGHDRERVALHVVRPDRALEARVDGVGPDRVAGH